MPKGKFIQILIAIFKLSLMVKLNYFLILKIILIKINKIDTQYFKSTKTYLAIMFF
ncbi:hypothetical protein SAMN05421825_3646 [Epilithonimonas hungarica]|uniref:Uncharacterized protein n=1 Tax=Epilithonimonas hungarica TaxID=454006 RepID=A0A1G7VJ46_9FLAO|nr:hypothetical protein SAMN05421825_3646 [Epilithonimonas hungarica]